MLDKQAEEAQRNYLYSIYWAERYKFQAEYYEREMYRLESLRLKGDFE